MLPKLDMYNYRIGASSVIIYVDKSNSPEISDILSELSQADGMFSLEGHMLRMESVEVGIRDIEHNATPLYLYVEEERLRHVRTKQNAV